MSTFVQPTVQNPDIHFTVICTRKSNKSLKRFSNYQNSCHWCMFFLFNCACLYRRWCDKVPPTTHHTLSLHTFKSLVNRKPWTQLKQDETCYLSGLRDWKREELKRRQRALFKLQTVHRYTWRTSASLTRWTFKIILLYTSLFGVLNRVHIIVVLLRCKQLLIVMPTDKINTAQKNQWGRKVCRANCIAYSSPYWKFLSCWQYIGGNVFLCLKYIWI